MRADAFRVGDVVGVGGGGSVIRARLGKPNFGEFHTSSTGNYLFDAGWEGAYAKTIIVVRSLTSCRNFGTLPSVTAEVALEASKLRVLLPQRTDVGLVAHVV